jgi:hypothetical protein
MKLASIVVAELWKVAELNAQEKYDAQVAALETFNSAAQGVYDRLCKTHDMLPGVLTAGFVGHRPEDRNTAGVAATAARVGHW